MASSTAPHSLSTSSAPIYPALLCPPPRCSPFLFSAVSAPSRRHCVELSPLLISTPSTRGWVCRPRTSKLFTREEYSSYCGENRRRSAQCTQLLVFTKSRELCAQAVR